MTPTKQDDARSDDPRSDDAQTDDASWMVVGCGRVGAAIARVLTARGALAAAWTRSALRADALGATLGVDVGSEMPIEVPSHVKHVLVALPDDVLPLLWRFLDASCREDIGRVWVHTSGVHDLQVLGAAHFLGARASCHPLVSFSGSADDVSLMQGSFFAVSGTCDGSRAVATDLARWCGGTSGEVSDEARTAYHLAAVLASNGVYALLNAAHKVAREAGIESDALARGLGQVALRSAQNAIAFGVDDAATGPVVRGDAGTVAAHVDWLTARGSAVATLYHELAEELVEVAERRGTRASQLAAIRVVLADARGKGG